MVSLIFQVPTALASQPISFGHNLAASNETLSRGHWTAGTYFLGTGITDNLTVGLSPWIYFSYNMDNVLIRCKHPFLNNVSMSHQFGYFKSNPDLGSRYIQESTSYWLTWGLADDNYKFLMTMNYMYFRNEVQPFSLRREPFNNQAHQLTLSSLNQFSFSENTILQFELGLLGMNYKYPYLHVGASWLHHFKPNWSLQVGASVSERFSGLEQIPDSPVISSPENYNYISLHPEIQIQYWF